MSGIYGTVKPANINIEEDVTILYSHQPSRSYDSVNEFIELEPTNLIHTTSNGTTIEGLYNLKLPVDIFGEKGIYTIYIKPKEIRTSIYAVGFLDNYSDVKGVVFEADKLPSFFRNKNGMVGYRIEYGDYTRIITSSNVCQVRPREGQNTFTLYSPNGGNMITRGKLIFCTVTPSTANGFTPNDEPPIGVGGDEVAIVNTKFNPIMLEVEMVEHDAETLSYMLTGTQVRNLDTGVFTTYNHNNEIYKQFDTYTVKTQLGKPLYDIKAVKEIPDISQNYNDIISNN